MSFKSVFNAKTIILGLSATAIVGGAAATIAQSAVASTNYGEPFVLIFKNGDNPNANSKYRLMGRHQEGYDNKDMNQKLGKPGFNNWEAELGLGLDNSNPAVQAEQLNWLYYLLFYGQIKESEKSKEVFKASNTSVLDNVKNSTFDGIRIDCGDAVDSDVLGQTGQLLDDLYDRNANDANANDHLSFAEGYGPNDAIYEKKYFKNSSLNYDDSYYQNMTKSIRWFYDDHRTNLNYATSYIADWNDDETINQINPNLTYSQNHDNFFEKIWAVARFKYPGFTFKNYDFADQGKKMHDLTKEYYDKMTSLNKDECNNKGDVIQISPKNMVTTYADLMINKDTVPIVFYGDLFEAQDDYMKTPTAVAEPIMDIINARSHYAAGGEQRRTQDNGNIMTNVRFGKGYYEIDGKMVDPKTGKPLKNQDLNTGRNSGVVTIFSNNKDLREQKINVYVGKNHAGQLYKNLIDTDEDDEYGLTTGTSVDHVENIMGVNPTVTLKRNDINPLEVNKDGYITVDIKGAYKPFVDGYLSMWVPDGNVDNIYVSEAEAQNMTTQKETGMSLNSNEALDSHVLYQDFGVQMPNQGLDALSQSEDAYAKLAQHAQDIADAGITDVWMAPPYTSPDQNKKGQLLDWVARYGYGYMLNDRYNLGEGETPSKYGTSQQLIDATNALHNANSKIIGRKLKTMVDLVPHQIIRGDLKEKVTFDEYSSTGFADPLHLVNANVTRYLDTITSNKNLQYTYGGKYLQDIKTLFSDIFSTKAFSTGELLPADEPIRNWSAKYEVTYPLEFGVGSNTYGSSSNHDEYYLSEKDY